MTEQHQWKNQKFQGQNKTNILQTSINDQRQKLKSVHKYNWN